MAQQVFVISDLHLGGEPGFQMCGPEGQALLAKFIPWVTAQHRPDPATFQHERQPELLALAQLERGSQRPATLYAVAAGITEPRLNQPRLQAHPFGHPAIGR